MSRVDYIKITYLSRKGSTLHKKGRERVQVLIEYSNVLGFQIQNWMLVVAGVVLAFAIFAWRTRDRV